MTNSSITIHTPAFPVHYADRDWHSIEVHEGEALGLVTLRNRKGEQVVAHAGDVKRALYSVHSSFTGGLITGTYGQTLLLTWEDAEAMVERFTANVGLTAPKGTVYSIVLGRGR